jgi:predicted chitinase
MKLTSKLLLEIMPHCPQGRSATYAAHLDKAMAEAKITGTFRASAFLAQLAHESGELRWWVEQSDGRVYEGRADLGNSQPGDGPRYKGRGPIQLTGRANYRAAGKAVGVDLEGHPEYACSPDVGFRVAAWYWTTHGLNELADAGDITAITRKINGGYNGLAQRKAYYEKAKSALLRNAS